MRNILAYPITKLEIDIELQRLIEEEIASGRVGGLRGSILQGLRKIVNTMWDVSPVQAAFEIVPPIRRFETSEGLPPWRQDLGCEVRNGLLIECEVTNDDDQPTGTIRKWVWIDHDWFEVGPALGRD